MPSSNPDIIIAEDEDNPRARHLQGYEYDSTDEEDEPGSDQEETVIDVMVDARRI
jgi:hypothetical protein